LLQPQASSEPGRRCLSAATGVALGAQGSELRAKSSELRWQASDAWPQASELRCAWIKALAAKKKALHAKLRGSIDMKSSIKYRLRDLVRKALHFARKDQSLAVQASMLCTSRKKAGGPGFLAGPRSAEPCRRSSKPCRDSSPWRRSSKKLCCSTDWADER
jgi:hypothetical protein